MNELYSILQPLEGDEPPRGFKRVQLDRNGNPVVRGSFLSRVGGAFGDRVWYVKPGTPCDLQRREMELADKGQRDKITLGFVLDVEIPESSSDYAVGSLVRERDPAMAIADAYTSAVQDWFRKDLTGRPGLRPLERIARSRRVLERGIAAEVGGKFGIHVIAHLDYDQTAFAVEEDKPSEEAKPVLRDLRISVPSFRVVLADKLSREVQLAVDLLLQREGEVREREPADEQAWRDEVRRILSQEGPRVITAAAYFSDLAELTRIVKDRLNVHFRRFGRSVRAVDLRPLSRLPVAPAQTINLELDWIGRPSEYRVVFQVSSNMGVAPESVNAFLTAGEPDYQTWLRDHARAALHAALVNKDFVDLAADYVEELRARLSEELEAAAAQCGMWIKFFVAEPLVPAIVATRTLPFHVESAKYPTRDGSFQGELEINVQGRFDDLRHVAHLIQSRNGTNRPAGELEQRLKEVAAEAAARVMRGAQPERYVLRFDRFVNVDGRPITAVRYDDGPPSYLADQIREQIQSDLAKFYRFRCAHDDIQLIQKDEKIARLIRSIMGLQTIQVKVGVEPSNQRGPRHVLPVEADYQVRGIDPENILVVLGHNYAEGELKAEVARQLGNWTTAFLEAFPYEILRVRDYQKKRALEHELEEQINVDAKASFGIVIRLSALHIGDSQADVIAHDHADLGLLIDAAEYKEITLQIEDPLFREELRRKRLVQSNPPGTSDSQPRSDPLALPKPSSNDPPHSVDDVSERPDGGTL